MQTEEVVGVQALSMGSADITSSSVSSACSSAIIDVGFVAAAGKSGDTDAPPSATDALSSGAEADRVRAHSRPRRAAMNEFASRKKSRGVLP